MSQKTIDYSFASNYGILTYDLRRLNDSYQVGSASRFVFGNSQVRFPVPTRNFTSRLLVKGSEHWLSGLPRKSVIRITIPTLPQLITLEIKQDSKQNMYMY